MEDALDGEIPEVIARINVGREAGTRPDALRTSNGGRFLWVSLQRDDGRIARFEIGGGDDDAEDGD